MREGGFLGRGVTWEIGEDVEAGGYVEPDAFLLYHCLDGILFCSISLSKRAWGALLRKRCCYGA